MSITLPNFRECFRASLDSTSTADISSSEYSFFITYVPSFVNIIILLTFLGGAAHPPWCRFHSCAQRPQRRLWCIIRRVAPAPGLVAPAVLPAVTLRPRRQYSLTLPLHRILQILQKTLPRGVPGSRKESF